MVTGVAGKHTKIEKTTASRESGFQLSRYLLWNVYELLKGEKDLNTIATENNIQPNLLRNWKKEFLDKASVVFDDTQEDNLKEKLALERKEKAEYAKKWVSSPCRWIG